jgi:hypothetical protein
MTFADTRIEKSQAEYTQADKKSVSSVESVSKNSSCFRALVVRYFWAKRAAILDQNPKKIKIFYRFLLLILQRLTSSLPAICCMLYAIFRPNAQLRPIIERRYFSAP